VLAWQGLWPGLAVCAVVGLAASFLARQYSAPVMLFALLLGMALNFLSQDSRCAAGVEIVSRQVLRWGVALLGFRLTLGEVADIGWQPLMMIALSVTLTLGAGVLLARLLGFPFFLGLLTGGAVAICGASAALALSAAMPAYAQKERATSFAVIGVSSLSSLAMMAYPAFARWMQWSPMEAGFFMGATIHDVAQVVGAGYSLSTEAGDMAVLVKLIRVALLLPVVIFVSWISRHYVLDREDGSLPRNSQIGHETGKTPPLVPWFVVLFAAFVGVNSTGLVPAALVSVGVDLSQACLVASMVAIGMRTQWREILALGWRPVALMVAETVFLGSLILALIFAMKLS